MPRTVHLMVRKIGPTLAGALEHEVGIEITVRLLSRGDLLYRSLHQPLKLGVRAASQRPGNSFHPLIHIGVIVHGTPVRDARLLAGGAPEIVYAPRLLKLPVHRR